MRATRIYGHGKLVGIRWVRDDDKPPSELKMLRAEIEELKLESGKLKDWVRWFLKEKLRNRGKKAKKQKRLRMMQPRARSE